MSPKVTCRDTGVAWRPVMESRVEWKLGVRTRRGSPPDRVNIPSLRSTCGTCRFCTRGQENLFTAPTFTGYGGESVGDPTGDPDSPPTPVSGRINGRLQSAMVRELTR